MFTNSKYTKWYFSIIECAKYRTINGYTELHHIIPKCLGGANSPDNLIKLTAREHFICHWLLTKMVTETKKQYQLWNAFSCMLYRERLGQERYKVSSKIFESIKSAGSKIKSERFKGENNPNFGKRGRLSPIYGTKQSPAHIEKLRKTRLGKKRTEESIRKQKLKISGKAKNTDHKRKISKALMGDKNPMYGKKLSPEVIAKRTATLKANKLAKKLAAGV